MKYREIYATKLQLLREKLDKYSELGYELHSWQYIPKTELYEASWVRGSGGRSEFVPLSSCKQPLQDYILKNWDCYLHNDPDPEGHIFWVKEQEEGTQ
jgi:hypothetical protein